MGAFGERMLGCLGFVLLIGAAFGIWTGVTAIFGSPGLHEFPSFKVGGLDAFVAQVQAAAKAGNVIGAVKTETCTEADSGAIAGLVDTALTGTPTELCSDNGAAAATAPTPLKPSLLVIDLDSGRPESINRELPGDVRAKDLASASTIGLVHCAEQVNGKYQNGANAVDLLCALVLVQRQGAGYQIVGLRNFRANAPAEIKRRSSDASAQVADRPDDDIKAYLLSRLPQPATA